jgi:hypothetical protein
LTIGTRSAITSRRAYPGLDSRESQHSQQETREENKLTSNGCKSAWKKVKTHQNDEVRYFLLLQNRVIIVI